MSQCQPPSAATGDRWCADESHDQSGGTRSSSRPWSASRARCGPPACRRRTDRVQAMLVALRELDVLTDADAVLGRAADVVRRARTTSPATTSRSPPTSATNGREPGNSASASASMQLVGMRGWLPTRRSARASNWRSTRWPAGPVIRNCCARRISRRSPDERDEVRRLLARLHPLGSTRRSLRQRPANRGALDAPAHGARDAAPRRRMRRVADAASHPP